MEKDEQINVPLTIRQIRKLQVALASRIYEIESNSIEFKEGVSQEYREISILLQEAVYQPAPADGGKEA